MYILPGGGMGESKELWGVFIPPCRVESGYTPSDGVVGRGLGEYIPSGGVMRDVWTI